MKKSIKVLMKNKKIVDQENHQFTWKNIVKIIKNNIIIYVDKQELCKQFGKQLVGFSLNKKI